MPNKAKIVVTSMDVKLLEEVCNQIKDIVEKTGVRMKGPVPLPTKKRIVVTRKSPCGEGSHTFDKWEIRIHRRYIEIEQDERTLRQFMRLRVPDEVQLRISLTRK